jgi:hypothetical protein
LIATKLVFRSVPDIAIASFERAEIDRINSDEAESERANNK